jgi:small-conductance mechanosensitive channel
MPDEIPIDQIETAVRDAAIPIILTIVAALLILRFARPLIRKVLRRVFESHARYATNNRLTAADVKKRVDTIETLGVSTIRFVVVILVIALVLAALNLGELVAALGLIFAALAFAGQDFVRDYIAGIFILVENQFYVGDVVQIAGVSGTVEDFTLRRTTLRDIDGALHIVSNGEIRIASNQTRGHAGINLDVPIGFDADVDRAMALIGEAGTAMSADEAWAPRILEKPTAVRVNSFEDTGLSIKVFGKVRAGDQWAVTGELRRRIMAAFMSAGITLPQRRIVIGQEGGQAAQQPAPEIKRAAGR